MVRHFSSSRATCSNEYEEEEEEEAVLINTRLTTSIRNRRVYI